ncbi:MAG: type IV secretory system conjugative DNA transfer family protein [Burkholderiales bacterium]|nr:type IV secretory system conjugative DNA transfer family protein [Burkholderiales bacterium]
MTQNASEPSPLWVRTLLVAALFAVAIPGCLWIAGQVFLLLAFRAKASTASLSTWYDYYQLYGTHPLVAKQLWMGLGAGALALFAPVALFFIRPKVAQHGEASFAKRHEIRKAGLLDNAADGWIVGKLGKDLLTVSRDVSPHIQLAAPTGSGKGVGHVIPNLLNWNQSVIVTDIKLENWQLTAGFRQAHGHKVFLFNPADPRRQTHRWNPLAYIRDDEALRIDDVQKIGALLFPDIEGTDPIWAASCRSLFLAVVLYILETPEKPRTLGQVAREIYAGDDKRFKGIIAAREADGSPLSPTCANAFNDYLGTSDNTRTSIRKTFSSRFELFLNPLVDAATAANDFDFRELRKQRMSIYIGITPDNLARMASLLNLFWQQIIDVNTRELPEHNPALKYQCVLLLDEFRAFGKMSLVVMAISFLRGYGLRLVPVFQSPSQVREIYGNDAAKTFFENHDVAITYTPANMDVATEISREMGNYTYKAKSRSTPLGLGKGSSSQSESEHARALQLPQEVKALGKDEEILFVKGCKPIKCGKIRWYNDPRFKSRVLPAPVVPVAPLASQGTIEVVAETRPVELRDVESLHERPLEDFSLDFSDVKIPSSEMSEAEAEALADQLYGQWVR